MRPFTLKFAQLIGREDFEGAIDYLRARLKGNASDVSSLEMIARCHHWAGRTDEAISTCREALRYEALSFDMRAMLAQLLADKGDHDGAAVHVRKGLENYPEPLPEVPGIVLSTINFLSRFFPRLRGVDPNEALKRGEEQRAEWFEWAKKYLNWYDLAYGDKLGPTKH